jgi:hypothetical protein
MAAAEYELFAGRQWTFGLELAGPQERQSSLVTTASRLMR